MESQHMVAAPIICELFPQIRSRSSVVRVGDRVPADSSPDVTRSHDSNQRMRGRDRPVCLSFFVRDHVEETG